MKKFLFLPLALSLLSFTSFSAVVTVSIKGFPEPGNPTSSPAPGGTTYTVNCSPSGATCTSYTVITPAKQPNSLVESYGVLTIYDNTGDVSESIEGVCKDIEFNDTSIKITLDSKK